MPPPPRSIHGVLQWIDQAQTTNRTWARNTLAVVGLLSAILLLVIRFGLLPG